MTDLAQYDTSGDYAALYHLAKKYEVICLIGETQNVGVTHYTDWYPNRVTIIGIGHCFICGEDQESFEADCKLEDVRWLLPSNWAHINPEEEEDDD
ncbi:hypothetical protein SCRM01_278 [Synechococcus phage S-CRM01]|uniref:hypothetical protein n=1 Tax=Synechococcus phage S-CRM01 TaxID=1026955 RepID=UPI000209E312|nr:hypothetical protein SCRM01_278 [Synechococcus phage S-CRM01]AEC53224.1 hypothetical protein SCRM01_278 [Synechococcus phage S-CRM01]